MAACYDVRQRSIELLLVHPPEPFGHQSDRVLFGVREARESEPGFPRRSLAAWLVNRGLQGELVIPNSPPLPKLDTIELLGDHDRERLLLLRISKNEIMKIVREILVNELRGLLPENRRIQVAVNAIDAVFIFLGFTYALVEDSAGVVFVLTSVKINKCVEHLIVLEAWAKN